MFKKRTWIVALASLTLWQCTFIEHYLSPLNPGPPPHSGSTGEGADQYGDALPSRAASRLGTVRLSGPSPVLGMRFIDDDARVVSRHAQDIVVWSVETGETIKRIRGYQVNGLDAVSGGRLFAATSARGVHLFDADGVAVDRLDRLSRDPAASPAFSADGQTLAVASNKLRVRVWRVSDGGLLHDLPGHTAPITALAASRQGRWLASASSSGAVRVWDARGGAAVGRWEVAEGAVTAMVFTADGTLVVSDGRRLILVDPSTGRTLKTIEADSGVLDLVSVPGRDATVCVADEAGLLTFWDLKAGAPAESFPEMGRVALSSRGTVMATGAGRSLRLWVREGKRELLWLHRHTRPVLSAGFARAGRTVWTHGADETTHLWEAASGAHLGSFAGRISAPSPDADTFAVAEGRKLRAVESGSSKTLWEATLSGPIDGLVWSDDGGRVAVTVEGEGVEVWDASGGSKLASIRAPGASALAFAPDGHLVYAEGRAAVVFDPVNGEPVHVLESEAGADIVDLAVSPDGRQLAAVDGQRSVALWRLGDGQLVTNIDLERSAVAVGFTPESARLGVGFSDGHLELWHLPSQTRLSRFRPHDTAIGSVEFERDFAVTTAGDAPAMVWKLDKLQPRRFFVAPAKGGGLPPGAVARLGESSLHHDKIITKVAQSPDGQILATSDEGGLVRLWGAVDGELRAEVRGSGQEVKAMAFTHDGRFVATTGGERVSLWDAATGAAVRSFEVPGAELEALAFDASSRRIAVGGSDRRVHLFDVNSGQRLEELGIHTGAIAGLAFSPFKNRVASASLDGTVIVWDLSRSEPMLRYKISPGGALAVAFSAESRTLVASGAAGEIKRFNMVNAERMGSFKVYAPARELRFVPGSQEVVVAGERYISIWDVASGQEVITFPVPESRRTSATFARGAKVLVTAAGEHTLRHWDLEKRRELLVDAGHHRPIKAIAHSPDGTLLATGSADKKLVLWDIKSGEGRAILRGHKDAVLDLAFSPDGGRLASASADGTVRVWDVGRAAVENVLRGHEGRVSALAFTPDGRTLYSAGADGAVFMWNVATGLQLSKLGGGRTPITAMALADGGKTLVYGGADGFIRTWSSVTRRHLETLRGHVGPVTGICVDVTGRLMASADGSGNTFVWRLDQGRIVASLDASGSHSLVFSPDGLKLATFGGDMVHLWDVASGEEILQISGYEGRITDLIFSRDGRRVFSANTDTTVLVWALDQATGLEEVDGVALRD